MLKHKTLLSGTVFVSLFIAALAINIGSSTEANAEPAYGCPALPTIGQPCTMRVTIKLRKVESSGKDEFHQRFEAPAEGWMFQDCDTRSGDRGSTGEVSGPSCVGVQKGNRLISSRDIQTQANQVFETIATLKGQYGTKQGGIFGSLESRSKEEFSNLERFSSSTSTDNAGVDIKAWVAVKGGCTHVPLYGCAWGPGGKMDTDVILRFVYVGTKKDIEQISGKYIAEAQQLALNTQKSSAESTQNNAPQFICDPKTQLITYGIVGNQKIPVIGWSPLFSNSGKTSAKTRCAQVSARLQQYATEGTLSNLTTGYINKTPVLCIGKTPNSHQCRAGGNRGNVLTLQRKENPKLELEQIKAALNKIEVAQASKGYMNQASSVYLTGYQDLALAVQARW